MHTAAILTTALLVGQASAVDEAFFEAKVRPVLVTSCFKCHGGTKTSHGLRVDSREALVKGGKSGPALVPGEPGKSLMLLAMQHRHDEYKMPPGPKLPTHVTDDFAAWIKKGAAWPASAKAGFESRAHWAFQPVQNVAPPPDPMGREAHPIDRFIAAKLREKGLTPAAVAEPRVLIRRLAFDLAGLPPTPGEVDVFVAASAKDREEAWRAAIDRLLASPRHGERWGRHWMDVVRYADTAGDNADYPIPEIVRYRDWIIDSFNADMPYDQFVRMQLAGDLLAKQRLPGSPRPLGEGLGVRASDKAADGIIATGFLALSRRYATAPFEFMHLTLEDTIDTTGAAFLGLTMRCARCHDHKFDPITREDYYGLYGIFASTTFPYAGSEEFASLKQPRLGFVPLVPQADKVMADYRRRLKELPAEIKKLEKEKANPDRLNNLRSEERILHRLGLPRDVPGAYAVSDGKFVEARIQVQGDPDKLGDIVPHRVPKFIEGSPVKFPKDASGRLELAQWLTRADNPLTARVIVNRVWQYHFGRGLVASANNFGTRGEPPTHPELLDHLAHEFVRHGWSIKWLHRYILTSQTYQLASTASPELTAKDPGNRWLGHYSRRRLDAEALRDAMLAVSGKLDLQRPGPHPFPPIQAWNWTQHNPFKDVYPSQHRSVYLMTQRLQKHPFLALFDGPDTNASTEKRTTALVPQQALFLMNDPFTRAQAEALAARMQSASRSAEGRIAAGIQLAWSRPATPTDIARASAYLERHQAEAKHVGAPADRVESEAWTSYARVLMMANEFLFVD